MSSENSDNTRRGVRVVRVGGDVAIFNNRRCRIAVKVEGDDVDRVVSASGPRDWHPSIRFSCDRSVPLVVCPEQEGPRGPVPDKTGAFEYADPSLNIVFAGE